MRTVSYTHLDVYKRQLSKWGAEFRIGWVAATALWLFLGALLVWTFYLFLHGAWRMGRL